LACPGKRSRKEREKPGSRRRSHREMHSKVRRSGTRPERKKERKRSRKEREKPGSRRRSHAGSFKKNEAKNAKRSYGLQHLPLQDRLRTRSGSRCRKWLGTCPCHHHDLSENLEMRNPKER